MTSVGPLPMTRMYFKTVIYGVREIDDLEDLHALYPHKSQVDVTVCL